MLIFGIVICFCISMFSAEAQAARAKHSGYDVRHQRIIINTIHINDRHLGYVKNNHLTLRDLITAKVIADESGFLDTEDVLRLIKRGYNYKKICQKCHVNWRKVDKRVNSIYEEMIHNSIKIGLTPWGIDEILN